MSNYIFWSGFSFWPHRIIFSSQRLKGHQIITNLTAWKFGLDSSSQEIKGYTQYNSSLLPFTRPPQRSIRHNEIQPSREPQLEANVPLKCCLNMVVISDAWILLLTICPGITFIRWDSFYEKQFLLPSSSKLSGNLIKYPQFTSAINHSWYSFIA